MGRDELDAWIDEQVQRRAEYAKNKSRASPTGVMRHLLREWIIPLVLAILMIWLVAGAINNFAILVKC